MYERLLDKENEPTLAQIEACLGTESYRRLRELEEQLQARYHLGREIRFPFGKAYGWGYKYSHRSVHLCYAFFEKGAFTVTVQIGDKQVPLLEACLDDLSPKVRALWENRYPCGERGGWVHYRVMCDEDVEAVCRLIYAKKKPM